MTRLSFLEGASEMNGRIRSFNWAETPLGPPTSWPAALRSALSICLGSTFPTAIYWGPRFHLLYNDAWSHILADRHPAGLGQPASEVWRDIWPVVGPQLETVLERGEGFTAYDQLLVMEREGRPDPTYWNYSFTPIRDENGEVVGVFNQGNDTTQKVVAERLHRFRTELESSLRNETDPRRIMKLASSAVGQHLQASRVGYGEVQAGGSTVSFEISYVDGVEPLNGVFRLDGFGAKSIEQQRTGFTVNCPDVMADPDQDPAVWKAIDTRAFASVPLIRNGQFVASFYVNFPEPHLWTRDELALIEDVAARTWEAVERARAEEGLRESEIRFRNMADSAPVMMWVTDPTGYCTYLNRNWFDFTGQTPDEALGYGWLSVTHPDDRDAAGAAFETANQKREAFRLEYRLRRRDGQYRWTLDAASPRFAPDGAFLGFVGSVIDIDERHEAERRLTSESEALEILNQSGAAIASEIDLERVVQTVTDAGVKLTGAQFGAFFYNVVDREGESYLLYSISGVPREHFSKFPMPRNTHVFDPTFKGEGIIRSDDITRDERYGRNDPHWGMPHGHLPVRSYLAVPVISRSGEVIGALLFGHPDVGVFTERSERLMVGIAAQAAIAIDNARLYRNAQHEIAERMLKELALSQSEEFSRSVLESSGDCIKILTLDGTIEFINGNGLKLLDLEDASAEIGQKWWHFWPTESRAQVEEATRTALEGGSGRFSAFRATGKGTSKWWDVIVTRVPGHDGKAHRLVSIGRDVTLQRKAEETQKLLLRELNHRVKNLFAIVSGMITMTARTSSSVADMTHLLKGRLTALAKAHELIRSAIKEDIDAQEGAQLEDLLRSVISPHLDSMEEDRLTLEGPSFLLGIAAATSLSLIFHEFATNAAKYGSLASPGGRLDISWKPVGETLEILWQETVVGHEISPPVSSGFGSKLAQSSATGQLSGTLDYEWHSSGVHIRLVLPQNHLR